MQSLPGSQSTTTAAATIVPSSAALGEGNLIDRPKPIISNFGDDVPLPPTSTIRVLRPHGVFD